MIIVTGNRRFLYQESRKRMEWRRNPNRRLHNISLIRNLEIYTIKIFDVQFKITYYVPEKKIFKTYPCLEVILMKFLNALEKQKLLPLTSHSKYQKTKKNSRLYISKLRQAAFYMGRLFSHMISNGKKSHPITEKVNHRKISQSIIS